MRFNIIYMPTNRLCEFDGEVEVFQTEAEAQAAIEMLAEQHQSNYKVVPAGTVEFYEAKTVETIKKGEYVRKISKDGQMGKKTFKRDDYDRETKKYMLVDCDDHNHYVYVKKGTLLAVGFTY